MRQRRSERFVLAVGAVAAVVVAIVVIRVQLLNVVTVSSDSMAPTVCAGDVLLVARLSDGNALQDNDIVTFTSPEDGAQTIKRVVGTAGQTVVIKDAELYVDGKKVDEPYVDHASIDGVYTPTVTVPQGSVFLMGDHRENSIDSRIYGPVPNSAIDGRLLLTLWSGC